ncbi:hypothetical protein D3C71_1514380 [compost metagenome]
MDIDGGLRIMISGLLELGQMTGHAVDAVFRRRQDVAVHSLLLPRWLGLHDGVQRQLC